MKDGMSYTLVNGSTLLWINIKNNTEDKVVICMGEKVKLDEWFYRHITKGASSKVFIGTHMGHFLGITNILNEDTFEYILKKLKLKISE